MYVRFYDSNSYNNSYYIGKSNTVFSIFTDSPGSVNVGIGTTRPSPTASLQVQGTLLTSNIGSYNSSTLLFNNQNIGGISNITFSGGLYQGNQPFKTSPWSSYSSSNVYITSNVAIGATSATDITGAGSNFVVVGDVYVTGQIKAATVAAGVVASASTIDNFGAYRTIPIFEPNQTVPTTGKRIVTNDANIRNRILYSSTLQVGRYMINGNLIFSNANAFSLFPSTKWAQLELYKMTPDQLVAAGTAAVPIRIVPFNTIHATADAPEMISFDWLIDFVDNFTNTFTILVSGKGVSLNFDPSSSSTSPVSVLAAMPIRGMGYDQSIAVNRALQVNPIKSSSVVAGSASNTFQLTAPGVFSIDPANVDVYVNGTKRTYVNRTVNDFTFTSNAMPNQAGYSVYSVTLKTPANIGDIVDITAWPVATSDTYFQSGYMYQNIFATSSPWQSVNDGGVRISNKVVVDGDLYVKGSIWGGCNTDGFASGVVAVGSNLIDQLSNAIGTLNIIDGCITPAKLNLMSGNVGVGTSVATRKLHVQGQSYFSSNIYVDGKVGAQTFMTVDIVNDATNVTTGTSVYSFRTPFPMALWATPRVSLSVPPPAGASVSVAVRGGSGSAAAATPILSGTLGITANNYSSVGSTATLSTTSLPDDYVITFDVTYSGAAGARGLKAIIYYKPVF